MTTHSAPSPVEPELDGPLADATTDAEGDTDATADDDGDLPPDAASALDIIRAQRTAVRDTVAPDSRLLLAAWGLAWGVGNLLLYVTARAAEAPHLPAGWAFAVYFVILAAAIAVTIVHTMGRSRGLVGPSGRSGAMFGWAWTIGFVGVWLIMTGLMRAGADGVLVNLGWSSLSCLVVGLLYLAAGAMWQSTVHYVLGLWIILVGAASTLAGVPGSFLVTSIAGGGGLLVGALVVHVRQYRGTR